MVSHMEPPARAPAMASASTSPGSRCWPPYHSRQRPAARGGLPASRHVGGCLQAHRPALQPDEAYGRFCSGARALVGELQGAVSLAPARERTFAARSRSVESWHASHLAPSSRSIIDPASYRTPIGSPRRQERRQCAASRRALPGCPAHCASGSNVGSRNRTARREWPRCSHLRTSPPSCHPVPL